MTIWCGGNQGLEQEMDMCVCECIVEVCSASWTTTIRPSVTSIGRHASPVRHS